MVANGESPRPLLHDGLAPLAPLFVVAIALATYSGTLTHALVWDDLQIVQNISGSAKAGGLGAVVWSKFMVNSSVEYFRPVPTFSLWLDERLARHWHGVFHLTNVLLHALNSLLVWRFCGLVLRSPGAAFIAGGLFAVHPVHSEPAAFVSGRTDLWATLFVLISAIAWCRLRQGWSDRPRLTHVAGAAAYLLACLSKETAVLLPVALLSLDVAGIRGEAELASSWWRRNRAWIAVWATALAIALLLRLGALGRLVPAEAPGFSPAKLPAPWLLLLLYFRLLAWPWPLNAYYSASQIGLGWPEMAAGVLVLGLLFFSFAKRRLQPALGASVWVVLFLFPVLGPLPLMGSVAAERFVYLPSVGFCLAAGFALDEGLGARGSDRARFAAALCVFGLLAAASFSRSLVWKNEITLFQDIVAKSPGVAIMRNNLAVAYSNAGRSEEAVEEFKRAIALWPDYLEAYHNLGTTYLAMHRDDAAIEIYREALVRNPRFAPAYNNLAIALQRAGHLEESVDVLRRGILVEPGDPYLRFNLAAAYLRLGNLPAAQTEREALLGLDPEMAAALTRLPDKAPPPPRAP